MDEQPTERIDFRHLAESGIFPAKIFQRKSAARAPAAFAKLLEKNRRTLALARDFANDLTQNIVKCDQSGGAAKFVQDNGHPALLPLKTFQQLQQVHGSRHKRRELDHLG